jgi:hypothetical protein
MISVARCDAMLEDILGNMEIRMGSSIRDGSMLASLWAESAAQIRAAL